MLRELALAGKIPGLEEGKLVDECRERLSRSQKQEK